MQFDEYLALAKDSKPIEIQEDWGQGRTTFGGMSAALILGKMIKELDKDQPLRAVNVSFCGPVLVNDPLEISTEVMSSGKSISQITGALHQDGKLRTHLNACFGLERTSSIQLPVEKRTDLGTPGEGRPLPFIKGVTPDFTQNVQLHWVEGDFPFRESNKTRLTGWARLKQTPTSFEDEHLLAIIDAWPPAVLPMLKTPCPTSSVTWNVEFVHARPGLAPDDWVYYECDVVQAEAGYAHTQARVFHPNGDLIALSRQLVTIYDQK